MNINKNSCDQLETKSKETSAPTSSKSKLLDLYDESAKDKTDKT